MSPKSGCPYRNFGERLGRLFQLRDDFLDYFQTSEATGKERYQDLKRGIASWPIIVLYKYLDTKQRRTLTEIFTKAKKTTPSSSIRELQVLFDCVNIRQGLERKIEAEVHILMSFLRKHPSSIYRNQLLDLIFHIFIMDIQGN